MPSGAALFDNMLIWLHKLNTNTIMFRKRSEITEK